MYIHDSNTGYGCGADRGFSLGGDPHFADFITERPAVTLPGFTSFSTTQCQINPTNPPRAGGYDTCSNMYNQGYYNEYAMTNCGTTDIYHTSVNSNNAFSTSYNSSYCL